MNYDDIVLEVERLGALKERLIKQGDERIDAINDWNLLVYWLDKVQEGLLLFADYGDNNFVDESELAKIQAELDALENELKIVFDYITSLNIEDKYEELVVWLTNISAELDDIREILASIGELLGDVQLKGNLYIVGSGYYENDIFEDTIYIDYNLSESLPGHTLSPEFTQSLLLSHNGVIQREDYDFEVVSIAEALVGTIRVTYKILNEEALGLFTGKVVYSGFALDNGLLPILTTKSVYTVDGTKFIPYNKNQGSTNIELSVNGVMYTDYLDYTYDGVEIKFNDSQYGVVYIVEQFR